MSNGNNIYEEGGKTDKNGWYDKKKGDVKRIEGLGESLKAVLSRGYNKVLEAYKKHYHKQSTPESYKFDLAHVDIPEGEVDETILDSLITANLDNFLEDALPNMVFGTYEDKMGTKKGSFHHGIKKPGMADAPPYTSLLNLGAMPFLLDRQNEMAWSRPILETLLHETGGHGLGGFHLKEEEAPSLFNIDNYADYLKNLQIKQYAPAFGHTLENVEKTGAKTYDDFERALSSLFTIGEMRDIQSLIQGRE